jgi:hypothetical protein
MNLKATWIEKALVFPSKQVTGERHHYSSFLLPFLVVLRFELPLARQMIYHVGPLLR